MRVVSAAKYDADMVVSSRRRSSRQPLGFPDRIACRLTKTTRPRRHFLSKRNPRAASGLSLRSRSTRYWNGGFSSNRTVQLYNRPLPPPAPSSPVRVAMVTRLAVRSAGLCVDFWGSENDHDVEDLFISHRFKSRNTSLTSLDRIGRPFGYPITPYV